MRLSEMFFPNPKTNVVCPNCQQQIENAPMKSGVCPYCKKKFYLCKDNETDKQVITDKEGRERILLKNKNFKRYIEWFNPFSHTEDNERYDKMTRGIIQVRNDWFIKNPNGTFNNFLWTALNQEINGCVQRKEYQNLSKYYKCMAILLNEEGKDNYQVLCESHKWMLIYLQDYLRIHNRETGLNVDLKVSIESSYLNKDLCNNCKKVVGKELLIDVAIKEKLLPVKDCTCNTGYCDCHYYWVWKVD